MAALGTVAVFAAGCAGRRTVPAPRPVQPPPPPPVEFIATAYCTGTTTASGAKPRAGSVAADPKLLPMGSIISVSGLDDGHNGVYTVNDTGPKVRGYHIDVYMRDCHAAVRFGRRHVQVSLLTR